MLPSWERLIYFNLQPALLDGLLSLLGVFLFLRLLRIQKSSLRSLFLFVPLVRPLLILVDGGAQTARLSPPSMGMGVRLPDPFHLIPLDLVGQEKMSTISMLVAVLILIATACILLLRWLSFLVFYRNLRINALETGAGSGKLELLVASLSQKLGIEKSPAVVQVSGRWSTPCAIGWRKPALVFDPDVIDQLDDHELRAVIAHELGHVRRRDGLWHWISVLLRDVQFFNPFSHISMAWLEIEREKACDRLAVEEARIPPQVLASSLVKVSGLAISQPLRPLPGYSAMRMRLIGSEGKSLECRVKSLLHMKDAGVKPNEILTRAQLGAGLFMWTALVLIQGFLCVWVGNYALVIK